MYKISKFQFLMVRLKPCRISWQRSEDHISIPYGSIKALRHGERRDSALQISIPYGSIKARAGIIHFLSITHFNSLWFD